MSSQSCNFGFIAKVAMVLLATSAFHRPAEAADAAQSSPAIMSGSAGEWGYRCVFPVDKPSHGPQLCLMQQSLMIQGKDNKVEPLGAVILARATEDTVKVPLAQRPWRVTAVVPLAVSLQKEVQLSVDNQAPLALKWQSCVSTGCMASLDLSPSQASLFQKGKAGRLAVEKMVGGTLTINFKMDGAKAGTEQIDNWIHHSPFR